MAKKRIMERVLKPAFFILLAVFAVIMILKYAVPDEGPISYENTLQRIAELDQERNMRFKDYYYGLENLRYNPRFPKPLNAGDIPAVIGEFEDIRDDVKKDRPSSLAVEMRINLLQAEMYYKIAMKFPLKGFIEDGFNCGDMPAVIEAAGNLNRSVGYGRLAAENMKELLESYPEEAKTADITKYRYTSINETFDELAERARKNENTINYFCLENKEYDAELEDDFMQAKDIMEEGRPAATG